MAWTTFGNLLAQTREASLQGLDPRERSVMVELETALPQKRKARLTFPCGGSVSGLPVWQRKPEEPDGPVMAAFRLPDLCDDTWATLAEDRPKEVRDYPRVPIRLWASFPEEARPGTVTKDLSPHGCCLEVDFSNRIGEIVSIYLDLPDASAPARLQAKIMWSENSNTGFKFLNLTACDEVRILRTLGEETTTPSHFLPKLELNAPAYTFRLSRAERTRLQLTITNWDVSFEFEDVEVSGLERGAFKTVEVLGCSPALRALRAATKIDLEESRKLTHLKLLDEGGKTILELVGREVGFWRESRSESRSYVEELNSA